MNQRAAFDETIALAEQSGMPELPGNPLGLEHMRDMRRRILDTFSDAKVGRWLGWAQAALVAADTGLTLEDVKQINLRHSEPHVTPEESAIDIMARYMLWQLVDVERVRWEDSPELGEYDFGRIIERIEEIAPPCPDLHERQDAYEFLTHRADGQET